MADNWGALDSIFRALAEQPPSGGQPPDAAGEEEVESEAACNLRVDDFVGCRTETVGAALLDRESHECRACNRFVADHDRAFAADEFVVVARRAARLAVAWLEAALAAQYPSAAAAYAGAYAAAGEFTPPEEYADSADAFADDDEAKVREEGRAPSSSPQEEGGDANEREDPPAAGAEGAGAG